MAVCASSASSMARRLTAGVRPQGMKAPSTPKWTSCAIICTYFWACSCLVFVPNSKEVIIVSSVEEIQSAIVSLPPEEYARLRAWFLERDWEQWDHQIAADAHAGKLDFLIAEAMAEKAQGHLRDL